MTKEILIYMVVQLAATVLLLKSCLFKSGVSGKLQLENCTKSKLLILMHSLLMVLQKGRVSFDASLLFSLLFSNIKFIVIALQIYWQLQPVNCRPASALKFTVYLLVWTTLCSVEHRTVLETEQSADWWRLWFSDTCSQENFVGTVFLSDSPCGQTTPHKILQFSFMKSMQRLH